jgi:hypothetical protein
MYSSELGCANYFLYRSETREIEAKIVLLEAKKRIFRFFRIKAKQQKSKVKQKSKTERNEAKLAKGGKTR